MGNTTFTYNGHTYLLSNLLSWQEAQNQAVSLGGNLVTINDAAEQAWLAATFTDIVWIGYTDQTTEGTFQWISGETTTYTNWNQGEPNDFNGIEDYAQQYTNGFWNDISGDSQIAGIIEINSSANNAPTLTTFSAPVNTGNENSDVTVSFTDLQAKGDEADTDGTVDAFVVKAVSSGALKIGLSPATATAWDAATNNTIDTTHQAYWTPDTNANGTLNAFTVVAKDNGGLESATPVQATIGITAVPDVNVIAGATPVEGGTTGTFVITLDSPAPVGGLTVNYNLAGTAALASDYTVTAGSHITTVTGSSFTIAAGETSALLNINALSDAVLDPNETVTLNLTTGTDYQLAQSAVTTFAPKVDYVTGLVPLSVSTGDFNNDGKLDLAVANSGSNTVSVLLRNAANTGFDAKVDYATGSYPLSVSAGDFNNDGKLDLAVANQNSNTVSVLLRNTANNGFDAKVDYDTGATPESVSTGDFNNDGKLDLVIANVNSNNVSVLLRNAANTGFDAKVDYATGLTPWSVSAGDFNNDGKLDLAVANASSNNVSVLLRNAANTGFDAKVDYATGSLPMSVSVGDFNNDGKLDLAVANQGSNNVSVLLRNADNTGFDARVDYATGSSPMSVSVGDFNNDGKLDLAVANSNSDTVSALLRNADNTGFDSKVDYATGLGSWSVSAGDFNNDGKLDLAVANPNSNTTVSVLLNNSNPTTLTITDISQNHAPILTAPDAIHYTDTAFVDNFAPVTGSFVASDSNGNSLTYGIVGGTGTDFITMSNAYGQLTVTKATGAYSFSPDSAAMEALSADATSTFTVTVSDGQLTDSKTLVINIAQSGVTESVGNDKLLGTAGNDVFNGLAGDDTISGLAGDDIINGGTGADTMLGGKGNDTYYIDNIGDKVVEFAWQGIDTIYYSIFEPYQQGYTNTYTLPDHVENLVHKGGYHPIGIGNELDNTLTITSGITTGGGRLYGLEGDDTLISYHGKDGGNTLVGGVGNDSYYVSAFHGVTDVIIEYAGEGEDTVYLSSDRYTLADNVENLVFVSGGIAHESGFFATGTGNALNNHLTSSLANTRLEGLGGDDNYYVGNEGAVIVELANDGWDTVLSTTSRTLEANVEELYLFGTDNINGFGNAQDNNLHGNASDNFLDGRAGADFMEGRAGNDTYYVDNAGDVVKELFNEGVDTVYSSLATYTLTANVENLSVNLERSATPVVTGIGNALDNYLTADGRMDISAHAVLEGRGGNDILQSNIRSTSTLLGGEGNDLYYIYNVGDVVKEYANQGTDTVSSSLAAYTLTDNVENLILRRGAFGDVGISGTGNGLANHLTGDNANNILDGRAGADTLVGGEGSDILIGGLGKDRYDLSETTAATDTVRIAKGDSLVSSYDVATGFKLGNAVDTAGVDKLDLDSTDIAADANAVNGNNSGNIKSHHISAGIISFDDSNHYTNALTITDANLANVFSYLQANITGQDTVAFVSGADTYVFQDGGAVDTLVELVGVTAHSLNTTGLGADALWLV